MNYIIVEGGERIVYFEDEPQKHESSRQWFLCLSPNVVV